MTRAHPGGQRVQRGRLGAKLRRLRLLAGLSGREIAAHVGMGQASVSRIENGQQVPSLPETMAWANAVGATPEQHSALTALVEAALNEVETWRARMRTEGLPAMQIDVRELEATANTLHVFQPTIVPGLLQTAEYARQVFTLSDVVGGGDYAGAVAARIERQQILYDKHRHFEFLLTETALRWRPGSAVLAAQLDRVASIATLDNVEVAVIPTNADMRAIPWCGFILYEDRVGDGQPFVTLETPHARLTVSDPGDVEIYGQQLALLRTSAVRGASALSLLAKLSEQSRPSDE